jgi:integrase
VDFRRRIIAPTKTKNGSPLDVHLNEDAMAAIETLKRLGQKPSDPVFPREGAKGAFDTRLWFRPCMAEAKITGYVWQSNRHTFCPWLAMPRAPIKKIQVATGHKTITMAAWYSHLSPEHNQSVVFLIAN